MRNPEESNAVNIDLNRPMSEVLAELDKYPVATRLNLTGTIIVGRDIAHAKIKERLDAGEPMPQYLKDHPIYTPALPRPPRGCPPARSARPQPDAWTRMSTSSRKPAAR